MVIGAYRLFSEEGAQTSILIIYLFLINKKNIALCLMSDFNKLGYANGKSPISHFPNTNDIIWRVGIPAYGRRLPFSINNNKI